MHEHHLEGIWVDPQHGGQIEIEQHEDSITGKIIGGQWHETLRGTFRAHRDGDEDEYEGEFVNHENVVEGHGTLKIKPLGRDEIRFSYEGDWVGGGTGGHVKGSSVLKRRGHEREQGA